jgi:hypothetical protein
VGLVKADIVDDLLIRDASTFGPVAVHAGCGEVPAVISSAVVPGDDVIDFQFYAGGLGSAVAARVIIAAKDFKSNTTG